MEALTMARSGESDAALIGIVATAKIAMALCSGRRKETVFVGRIGLG
jgi:hypothetical protein